MTVGRESLEFDFGGACFDLSSESDRRFLGWVFNQFLYGEVTGIQCGHWLYRAPHLNAAQFLAKQASEELSHVRKISRILSLLGERPKPAHWAIRFLSTGMMGGSWGEHVALEMALGEGLVLMVFYALARTIPNPRISRILESAIAEEELHVEFGERETRAWLSERPWDREFLLAQSVIQAWVLSRLKNYVLRSGILASADAASHPVLSQFERFYEHCLECFELRIEALGLCDSGVRELSPARRLSLILRLPLGKLLSKIRSGNSRLTSTYLDDPTLQAEASRYAEALRESGKAAGESD